jgi:hypothetical protein
MQPQAINLLGRNVEMASSWKVKNTNGKSKYERSNRLFDFNLSRQSGKPEFRRTDFGSRLLAAEDERGGGSVGEGEGFVSSEAISFW